MAMVKRIVALFDVHATQVGVATPYSLVKRFIKDYAPDETIIGGDFMDCESISHWLENKQRMMENKRLIQEYAVANAELDYLQKYSLKVTYLEGNHENWVEQYLDKHPACEGFLELQTQLHLDARGIAFHPINTLYKVGKLYVTHGMYVTQFHAKKHLVALGCSIMYGHTHTAQTYQMNMKMQEPIMAYGIGCLCGHSPHYLKNKPANWLDQFAVIEVDETGRFNVTPVNITDNQFIFNGKRYRMITCPHCNNQTNDEHFCDFCGRPIHKEPRKDQPKDEKGLYRRKT